jgi:hypothetical protein
MIGLDGSRSDQQVGIVRLGGRAQSLKFASLIATESQARKVVTLDP